MIKSYTLSNNLFRVRPDKNKMCEDLLSSESESESKRPKYAQKYKMEWEVNRPWLKNESGSAYCRLCKKILDNNLTNLNRHVASKSHNKK